MGFILFSAGLLWSCSGDDDGGVKEGTPPVAQTGFTTVERQFANLDCSFYKPNSEDYKGIVTLGSGNDPLDPSEGSLNDGYLIALAGKLADAGYLVAIVAYRDEPPVGDNWQNWASNATMLAEDLSDVGTDIAGEFGLERSDIVLGGSSYAANALISHSAWGMGTFADTRGFIAIMGSSSLETAQNIKSPVLAFACNGEPYESNYGQSIYDNIASASVKSKSYGFTDATCSGHSTSNAWQDVIVQKVQAWLP